MIEEKVVYGSVANYKVSQILPDISNTPSMISITPSIVNGGGRVEYCPKQIVIKFNSAIDSSHFYDVNLTENKVPFMEAIKLKNLTMLPGLNMYSVCMN